MQHVMLDLETLGTSNKAVVLSIGAVKFDPYSSDLGQTFYVELTGDLKTQQANGRIIDASTVLWWMQQGAMAKQVFSDPPIEGVIRASTVSALLQFRDFINDPETCLWGNGADFDNAILADLYRDMAIPVPWSFRFNRCFRTIKGMFPEVTIARDGVHHNALDDAVHQAKHLQEIMKCIAQP